MNRLDEIIAEITREHLPNPAPAKKYKCLRCRDKGFLSRIDGDGYEIFYQCECSVASRARDMIKRSGISPELQQKTFGNFNTKGNEQLSNAKAKAAKYAEDFIRIEHDRRNSMLLCGQVGAGKTHLGMAVCGSLMDSGVAVIYMAYRNAVTKIKQSVIDEEAYSREMSQYMSARVLYVDDLLKGKLTEADINIMYEIVNYRYMNNMPMVISTEKTPNDILAFDEATGSRIIEMCRGNIVQFRGKELNYRLS